MTELEKITITKEYSNTLKTITWKCVRERAGNWGGETAGGLRNLEEVFQYIRAHDVSNELIPNGKEEG